MTIPLPALGNDHLYLRPYELDDFDDFTDLMARPDLMQHVGDPMSIREAGQLFHAITKAYHGSNIEAWAVHLLDRDEYIGHAMLRRRLPEDDPALSFVIREQYWARGVAPRIVTELLGYAFDVSRHNRVLCTVDSHSLRAIRALERAGMKLETQESASRRVYVMKRPIWEMARASERKPG